MQQRLCRLQPEEMGNQGQFVPWPEVAQWYGTRLATAGVDGESVAVLPWPQVAQWYGTRLTTAGVDGESVAVLPLALDGSVVRYPPCYRWC